MYVDRKEAFTKAVGWYAVETPYRIMFQEDTAILHIKGKRKVFKLDDVTTFLNHVVNYFKELDVLPWAEKKRFFQEEVALWDMKGKTQTKCYFDKAASSAIIPDEDDDTVTVFILIDRVQIFQDIGNHFKKT